MRTHPGPAGVRPLRVAAFTGGATVPSARFRVRQYIGPLAAHGIAVREAWPGLGAYPPRNRALRPAWLVGTLAQRLPHLATGLRADLVLFQRELVSTLATVEGLSRHPRVVDIDDSMHLHRGGRAARRLAALADLVIVGNSWLAEIWRAWNARVEILPTAVDTNRYDVAPFPDRPTVGWIGSAGNLQYLGRIAPALVEVLRVFPEAEIAVCCDRPPHLPGLPLRYVPWSSSNEADFLASLTVGVMPLANGPWERGKCSFKMLQYMAAGRPCVVSPVGMNNEILDQAELGLPARSPDEWKSALCALLADRDLAQRMGEAGRSVASSTYSLRVLAPRLAEVMHRLA
jgi:glycosyltransferase involved in cell wall biosynthesis